MNWINYIYVAVVGGCYRLYERSSITITQGTCLHPFLQTNGINVRLLRSVASLTASTQIPCSLTCSFEYSVLYLIHREYNICQTWSSQRPHSNKAGNKVSFCRPCTGPSPTVSVPYSCPMFLFAPFSIVHLHHAATPAFKTFCNGKCTTRYFAKLDKESLLLLTSPLRTL